MWKDRNGRMIVTPEDWKKQIAEQEERVEAALDELKQAINAGDVAKAKEFSRWLRIQRQQLDTMKESARKAGATFGPTEKR